MRTVAAMVHLQASAAAATGTAPVVLLEHFNGMKFVDFANQDIQRQFLDPMCGFYDHFLMAKGAERDLSFGTVDLPDFVPG